MILKVYNSIFPLHQHRQRLKGKMSITQQMQVTVRFRIPLQKLEKFCAEHKVSVAHVAVKAVATGLRSSNEVRES